MRTIRIPDHVVPSPAASAAPERAARASQPGSTRIKSFPHDGPGLSLSRDSKEPKRMSHRLEPVLAILLFFIAAVAQADTGYIVLAPDRGFVGNNLARDAVEPFAEARDARLVF